MGLTALIKKRFKSRRAEVNPYLALTPQHLGYQSARQTLLENTVRSDHECLYEPLQLNRHQIRLLEVDQLDFDEHGHPTLHCSLAVVSLEKNTEYDALSYTWGDPNDLENIQINSHVIPVTRNLFDALSTLKRSRNLQRRIWVDAVCIDQENIYERNQQVSLMTEIYSRAHTVRIWLGFDIPEVELFFVKAGSGAIFDYFLSSHNNDDDGSLDGFGHVISRPWWRRLWVVQEAVLARYAIVHCGHSTIPWKTLRNSIEEIAKAPASLDYTMGQLESIGLPALVQSNDSIGAFEPWKSLIRGPSEFGQLIILMGYLSRRNMSDDKDLVYGALGLLPEYLRVSVDYSLSLSEVYQSFAVRIMEWTGSLQLLSECQCSTQDKLWPSWVPDFRRLDSFLIEPRYNPSFDGTYRVPRKHGNGFVVQAHIFDEVYEKGRPSLTSASFYSREKTSDMTFLRTVLRDWLNLTAPFKKDMDTMDGNIQFWSTICQALPATIIGLDASQMSARDETILSELQHWLDSTETELTPSAEKHLLSKNLYNGTFCVSKSGRRILCRKEPNLGDRIAIIPTCRTPLLLRPCSDERKNVFQIVSCCFCEGVMYGEYVCTQAEIHVEKSLLRTDELTNRLLNSVRQLHRVPNAFVNLRDLGYFKSVLAQISADIETNMRSVQSGSSQAIQSTNGAMFTLLDQLFEHVCREGSPASAGFMVNGLVIDESDRAKAQMLIIFTACAFDDIMSKFETTQRQDGCEDQQLRETIEALALCVSIYTFEIIICVERTKSNYDGPVITEHFRKMQQLVDDAFGLTTKQDASKKWYAALKHLALQEFEIEKASISLYQDIMLV